MKEGTNFLNELEKAFDGTSIINKTSVRMYNRDGKKEDPWLSYHDHHNDTDKLSILYGEGTYPGNTYIIKYHNGANVYIRKSNTLS